MVSIGVYARMMKHAGKCHIECLTYAFISTVVLQSLQISEHLHVKGHKLDY